MRKICFLIIILMGLISTQVSGKWFQQKTIYSKSLQQEKTYYVGLPKGYNESDTITKYPVIIFLHGASITATDMVNSLEPFLDNFFTKFLFDKLFKVIFVIPDGSCEPYKGSFYTNSSLYGNYEDYIVKDMMEEVAGKYHTYKAREKWSIMGHSMGGYGAMKIALTYPQKYIGISSLSGPLNITYFKDMLPLLEAEHGAQPPYDFSYDGSITKLVYSMAGAFSPNPGDAIPVLFPVVANGNLDPIILAMWEKHNPINLIKQWQGKPAMGVYTYCGDQDEFKLAVPNKMFSDTLAKYQIKHSFNEDPLGDHVNSLFTSMPQGINFLYQVMDTAKIRINTTKEELAVLNHVTVFPNPASDYIYVSCFNSKIRKMVLLNIEGQKLKQIDDNSDEVDKIDIRYLQNGIYILSLMDESGKVMNERFIKK